MHLRELNRLNAVGDVRAVDTRAPSRAVWRECPWTELQNGTRDGFAYFDTFLSNQVQAANVAAASTTLNDPWAAFTNATAGATVASGVSPTDATGAVVLASTTAQEGVHMGLFTAKNTAAPIDALSATNRVWFEGRVKVSGIATTESCLFFGLMKVGRAVTLGTIATLGAAVAAVDHVGFLKATVTAPTAIQTSIGDGTSTIVNAAAGTFAANTYATLGFYWNGTTGVFYVNGVADSTTISTSSTQFPTTDSLTLMIGLMAGAAGTAQTATFDWVRVAHERVLGTI